MSKVTSGASEPEQAITTVIVEMTDGTTYELSDIRRGKLRLNQYVIEHGEPPGNTLTVTARGTKLNRLQGPRP